MLSLRALLLGSSFVAAAALHGQGSLTPPGAPAPTLKSLQEIWDKVGAVEAQAAALQTQITAVQTQNTALLAQNTALQTSAAQERYLLATVLQDQLPWRTTTVDAVGSVGFNSSLEFGPDGQPAISYCDVINGDLRFARFNGTTWTLTTVDAVGNTGPYASLAFGPDGRPAISYQDVTNLDLRFARSNGSTWTTITIDASGVSTGAYTSLAFGPDGQPAISYQDLGNSDLRFAQRYTPTP